jgi:hypothetical protein
MGRFFHLVSRPFSSGLLCVFFFGSGYAATTEKPPASALDLFDELEGYEESSQTREQQARSQKALHEVGKRKEVVVKDPRVSSLPLFGHRTSFFFFFLFINECFRFVGRLVDSIQWLPSWWAKTTPS